MASPPHPPGDPATGPPRRCTDLRVQFDRPPLQETRPQSRYLGAERRLRKRVHHELEVSESLKHVVFEREGIQEMQRPQPITQVDQGVTLRKIEFFRDLVDDDVERAYAGVDQVRGAVFLA